MTGTKATKPAKPTKEVTVTKFRSEIEKGLEKIMLKPRQEDYVRSVIANQITFCSGPAGTSKTFSACYAALRMFADKQIERIILTKPIVESGEKIGYLPGSIDEKIGPYMESYVTNFYKIIGEEATNFLLANNIIELRPLPYMRGATFDNCLMVLDEAQNCDFAQLMLYITRMGRKTKVLIAGDVSQYDINYKAVSLPDFINLMDGIKGVGHFMFTKDDIVRAKILIDIVDRYEEWKHKNEAYYNTRRA